MLPSAHVILWTLGTFIVLWACSLAGRGLWGDRARGRRRCPACGRDVRRGLSCAACGYEAVRERDLRAPIRQWGLVGAGLALIPVGVAAWIAGEWVRRWSLVGTTLEPRVTPGDCAALGIAAFAAALLTPPAGRGVCPPFPARDRTGYPRLA